MRILFRLLDCIKVALIEVDSAMVAGDNQLHFVGLACVLAVHECSVCHSFGAI